MGFATRDKPLSECHIQAIKVLFFRDWRGTPDATRDALAAAHDRQDWSYFASTNLDPRLDQWDNRRK